MGKKRFFDLFVTLAAAVVWLPAVLMAALAVLVLEGRPVFYKSTRRVSAGPPIKVVKFRTMVRNAAEIANRETVPVDGSTRFLNIPSSSPLYTRIGRLLEKVALTELPQFRHVLRGEMSIVGNRPLPQNVVDCLLEEFPDAEDRFATPAGLTGPSQLVGRDYLCDEDRLALEGAYCRGALRNYSFRLDFLILLYTVLVVLRLRRGFAPDEVIALVERYTGASAPVSVPAAPVGTSPARVNAPTPAFAPAVTVPSPASAGVFGAAPAAAGALAAQVSLPGLVASVAPDQEPALADVLPHMTTAVPSIIRDVPARVPTPREPARGRVAPVAQG
ncbi:sugar transferase [Nocardioides alcanivorans]|uniref:sugar transferase n=1 Tax=Nocardioides alcanivorans TaxID=2897352 RepID=UPI001F2214B2|nr:sugar transferase [Nocardioides alcanivorans]